MYETEESADSNTTIDEVISPPVGHRSINFKNDTEKEIKVQRFVNTLHTTIKFDKDMTSTNLIIDIDSNCGFVNLLINFF